jgi:hypothetical protein
MIRFVRHFCPWSSSPKWQTGDPVGSKPSLSQAAEAQAAAKRGVIGKVLPLAQDSIANNRHEGKIGDEKSCTRNQPLFETKWRRMRRMLGVAERLVVSSPPVGGVWAHRML